MRRNYTDLRAIEGLRLREKDDSAFEQCGHIAIKNGRFDAAIGGDNKKPGVYLWVAENRRGYEIVYVGKAKNGPKTRLSQHQAGINGRAATAKKRREKIQQVIDDSVSDRLLVFFRESANEPLLDIKASTYSLDEEALILALDPVLNRSKPPVIDAGKGLIMAISEEFSFSNSEHLASWITCIDNLSGSRRRAIESNIDKLKTLVGDSKWSAFDLGVIQSYSSPKELAHRPVLVFGRFATKQFSSKFALIALDEEKLNKPDVLFFLGDINQSYSSDEFVKLSRLPRRVRDALSKF